MSVPPSPTPPHNPTTPGYTHHMHHLGSLQGLHPNFDSKAIPGAPGQAGYHHYDHHRWNRQFQRGYQRAPIRTKVLWFLLGVGATTIFSRRHDNYHNPPHHHSPLSSPPSFSTQTDATQPQSSWKCKTRTPSPPFVTAEVGKGGMTVMEPITIGQAEPKAREITREEAIRDVFVSSPTAVATSKDKQLNQINESLKGMDEGQLARLGRIVKEFVL